MKNYHLKMLISSCVLGLLLTIAHPANAQHSVNITIKINTAKTGVISDNFEFIISVKGVAEPIFYSPKKKSAS